MRWTAEIEGAPTELEHELAAELQGVAKKFGADTFTFIGRLGRVDLNADLSKVAEAATAVEDVAKVVPVPGASEVATVAADVAEGTEKAEPVLERVAEALHDAEGKIEGLFEHETPATPAAPTA